MLCKSRRQQSMKGVVDQTRHGFARWHYNQERTDHTYVGQYPGEGVGGAGNMERQVGLKILGQQLLFLLESISTELRTNCATIFSAEQPINEYMEFNNDRPVLRAIPLWYKAWYRVTIYEGRIYTAPARGNSYATEERAMEIL